MTDRQLRLLGFPSEIGHGLGLTPPFGTDLTNEPLFPGVTNRRISGEFGYNQMVYTALSHNRGQYIFSGTNFGYPVTPMAFDIAAIQFLYGPNTTYHSGSDGYGLPDENAPGTTWQCIWDTGGTDTILYDGKKNATIDLRPASLVFGDPIAGGAISKVDGIFGGLTIANGVVIENAAGGSGNDTLRGNSANNVLDGKAGDDTAVFSGNRASYSIQNLETGSSSPVRTGPIRFSRSSILKFADITIDLNAPAAPCSRRAGPSPPWPISTATARATSIWHNASNGSIDLWKISIGQWAGSVDVGRIHWAGSRRAIGDLNGDGTNDLLWHNPTTGNADLGSS